VNIEFNTLQLQQTAAHGSRPHSSLIGLSKVRDPSSPRFTLIAEDIKNVWNFEQLSVRMTDFDPQDVSIPEKLFDGSYPSPTRQMREKGICGP